MRTRRSPLASLKASPARARSPYPSQRPLAEVWDEVLRSPEDKRTAEMLGLSRTPSTRLAGPLRPRALPAADGAPPTVASAATALDDGALGSHLQTTLQVVWWVKVLRDDPLRVLRALRFAAKYGFALHDTFWSALPFSLLSLKTKVAGSRKVTELLSRLPRLAIVT